MSIIATNEGVNYDPAPGGTFAARCYAMVHIGTVEEVIEGRTKRMNKVRISWELPTEKKVFKEELGEQPIVIHKEFTLSMSDKANLRKFLESWRGKAFSDEEAKAFDVTKLLGVACLLTIVQKPKKTNASQLYADIASVSAVPKGMTVDPQINPNFEFNYNEPFDKAKFETLPEWLRKKMMTSDEYKQAHQGAPGLSKEEEASIAKAAEESQMLAEEENIKGIGNVNEDLPF